MNTADFRKFGVGALAYMDTFAGLVPCKVLEILKPGANGRIIGHDEIKIEITKTVGAYRKGEHLAVSAAHTPPRKMVYTPAGGFFRRILCCYVYAA